MASNTLKKSDVLNGHSYNAKNDIAYLAVIYTLDDISQNLRSVNLF